MKSERLHWDVTYKEAKHLTKNVHLGPGGGGGRFGKAPRESLGSLA